MSEATSNAHGKPVYAISVAAELLGVGVQMLRIYESRGLVEPARTSGGTRRYSERDLERVGRVTALLSEGLNLAGVAMVLELQDENERLKLQREEVIMPTEKRIENNEIPESDLLDQLTPIDPSDTSDVLDDNRGAQAFVNEADWVDQQIPVPIDEFERE